MTAPSVRVEPGWDGPAPPTGVVIDGRAYDPRLGFPPPPDPEQVELNQHRAKIQSLYRSLWRAQNPKARTSFAWTSADDAALVRFTATLDDCEALSVVVEHVLKTQEPEWLYSDREGGPRRTPTFRRIAANVQHCQPPPAELQGAGPPRKKDLSSRNLDDLWTDDFAHLHQQQGTTNERARAAN